MEKFQRIETSETEIIDDEEREVEVLSRICLRGSESVCCNFFLSLEGFRNKIKYCILN